MLLFSFDYGKSVVEKKSKRIEREFGWTLNFLFINKHISCSNVIEFIIIFSKVGPTIRAC